MSDLITDTGATFSECGLYRYDLWRLWDESKPTLTFIMLNPSTADAETNDPTVERCQRRAMKMGFGQVRIANLMAYRATDPADLKPLSREERFGPKNDQYLLRALKHSGMVICGWGRHGSMGPVDFLIGNAESHFYNRPLYALKVNKDGSPQHPLYVSYSAQPVWWAGADPHPTEKETQ